MSAAGEAVYLLALAQPPGLLPLGRLSGAFGGYFLCVLLSARVFVAGDGLAALGWAWEIAGSKWNRRLGWAGRLERRAAAPGGPRL